MSTNSNQKEPVRLINQAVDAKPTSATDQPKRPNDADAILNVIEHSAKKVKLSVGGPSTLADQPTYVVHSKSVVKSQPEQLSEVPKLGPNHQAIATPRELNGSEALQASVTSNNWKVNQASDEKPIPSSFIDVVVQSVTASGTASSASTTKPVAESTTQKDIKDDPTAAYVPLKENVVAFYVALPPITRCTTPPKALSASGKTELENVLNIHASGGWSTDWSGNLAHLENSIENPFHKNGSTNGKSNAKKTIFEWARSTGSGKSKAALPSSDSPFVRSVYNLLRLVYHHPDTPQAARDILGSADPNSLDSLDLALRRVSYDPKVLEQDGWTVKRSTEKEGATGGPYWIGAKVRWQDSDAVVIAYVHDPDIGDLWKAFWIEEEQCFDLEAEEITDAHRKWVRRSRRMHSFATGSLSKSNDDVEKSRKSSRFAGSVDFSVDGIEHGIVLAASYSKGARPGVFWPARVANPAETKQANKGGASGGNKRSMARQKVDLVFLAPYWLADDQLTSSSRSVKSRAESQAGNFREGPLFLLENVDASSEMIKPYTMGNPRTRFMDVDALHLAFRFTGLPKPAFSRFLDAHRLAVGLRYYAAHNLKSEIAPTNDATSRLLETHIMSIQSPVFPPVILNLPFEHILNEMEKANSKSSSKSNQREAVLMLSTIIEAMKPPNCFGLKEKSKYAKKTSKPQLEIERYSESSMNGDGVKCKTEALFASLLEGLEELTVAFESASQSPVSVRSLRQSLESLLSTMIMEKLESYEEMKCFVNFWLCIKATGATLFTKGDLRVDWMSFTEAIYRRIRLKYSTDDHTLVLTDHRCNGHRTGDGCFERAVRLPAALKGCNKAMEGQDNVILLRELDKEWIQFSEEQVLNKIHSKAYLDRIKKRCMKATSDTETIALTDDSDGNGGHDTRKCLLVQTKFSVTRAITALTFGFFFGFLRGVERYLGCCGGSGCCGCCRHRTSCVR